MQCTLAVLVCGALSRCLQCLFVERGCPFHGGGVGGGVGSYFGVRAGFQYTDGFSAGGLLIGGRL